MHNPFIQQPKTTLSIEKLKDQIVLSQEAFGDVSVVHALIDYPMLNNERSQN